MIPKQHLISVWADVQQHVVDKTVNWTDDCLSVACCHLVLVCSFHIEVLALQSWCKGINAPSIRSLVVNGERMRPDHWLGFVLSALFSALMLMVGWQQGHLACKTVQ